MGFQPLPVGLSFDRQTSKGPKVIRLFDFYVFKFVDVLLPFWDVMRSHDVISM